MDGSFDIVQELRQLEQQGVLQNLHHIASNNEVLAHSTNDRNQPINNQTNRINYDNDLNETVSNELLFTILDEISDGCIIINSDFIITYINQTTENMLHVSGKEIVGLRIDQIFNQPTAAYFKEQCQLVLFEKKKTSFERNLSNKKTEDIFCFNLLPITIGALILFQKKDDTIYEFNKTDTTDKYRDIFELSPEGIITVNKKSIVTECNPAFLELTGFSKQEIIGKTTLTLPTLPLSTKFQMAQLLQSLLKGEISKDPIAFDWKRKDGELRKGNAIIGLLKKDGKIQGIQAILRDTTDEIAAEQKIKESQERFKALFNNSLELVYIHDFKGNFIDANDACLEALGYTREEIKSLNFQSFLDKKQFLKALHTLKNVKKQGSQKTTTEYTLLCKNGTYLDVETTSSIIYHNGKRFAVQGVARDITERKKAEEEIKKTHNKLKELNKNLEDIVEKRTEQIQILLKQKDDFINQLGHDLKNPLGPLLNLIPVLEKKEEDPQKKELLHVVNRNVLYMKNLVNKTIQLAQLKSPNTTLHYEIFNLKAEVDEIILNNHLMFEENGMQIQNQLPNNLTIHADKLRIQELFNNILNNAVKYRNGQSGQVVISLNAIDQQTVTVSISDQGIGMTKEQLNQVFNEFYKADSSRHDFDSSGLGMSICKRIIEMHGGNIWVESQGLNQGSCFFVQIPLAQ